MIHIGLLARRRHRQALKNAPSWFIALYATVYFGALLFMMLMLVGRLIDLHYRDRWMDSKDPLEPEKYHSTWIMCKLDPYCLPETWKRIHKH